MITKRNDLIKLLIRNGWYLKRNGASHDLYTNGTKSETIPRHTEINENLAKRCEEVIDGLQTAVLPVKNEFFGETVTCTGLLTGKDILRALEKYRRESGDFDEVILAGNTMKEFEDVFLCGMTLDELKKKSGMENIRVNRDGGYGFVDILSTNG